MRKIILCLLLTALFCAPVMANTRLTEYTTAKVIEIIDGDAIAVLTADNQKALIRLYGIDVFGGDAAKEYLTHTILGKTVTLSFNAGVPSYINNRWNNMNVFINDELVNLMLVSRGLADVLPNAGFYEHRLTEARDTAKSRQIGIWNKPTIHKNHYPDSRNEHGDNAYIGGGININTASFNSFREHMPEISSSDIYAILAYRAVNPFKTITDLKFVPGFTAELFNKYRNHITISTNITNATEAELLTLGYITDTQAANILNYRKTGNFTDTSGLLNFITQTHYDSIKPYVAVTSVSTLSYYIPNKRVSIAAATADDLMDFGLSSTAAAAFLDGLDKYTYKSLGELRYLPGAYLSDFSTYSLVDNLILSDGDFININFASYDALAALGFSAQDARAIYAIRGTMYNHTRIPVPLADKDSRVSLFTNVNKASRGELTSLGISPAAVDALIAYRQTQPITSAGELESVLVGTERDGYNTYNDIRYFVVWY